VQTCAQFLWRICMLFVCCGAFFVGHVYKPLAHCLWSVTPNHWQQQILQLAVG